MRVTRIVGKCPDTLLVLVLRKIEVKEDVYMSKHTYTVLAAVKNKQ